jgi:DNA-binding CsgD family transcriptional regulator
MKHLANLSILLVLVTGSASLTFAFIVYLKEKNPLFRHHLIILLLITINLIIIQALFYIYSFQLFPKAMPWLRLFSTLDSSLIITQCIFLEYPAKVTVWYRITDRIFKALGILAALMTLAIFFFFSRYFFIARDMIFILLFLGLACNAFMILFEKNPHQYKDGFNWRLYTKSIVVLYIILLPILFILILSRNDLSSSLPYYFLVYPAIYFAIHLYSTIFLVRRMLLPHYEIKPVLINPTAAKRYGLSDREAEIAAKLVEGMSYNSIAQSLFISQATVKTHIQSIYRKVDVKRRQDLVQVFQDNTGRDGK